MEFVNGKLVVDELILDPSLPQHVVVRIGAEFFMIRQVGVMPGRQLEKADVRPYRKQVSKDWYRPHGAYHFWVNGLMPRGGYPVEAGRPATDSEFAEIVSRFGLTDDDISDVFTDSRGELFGEEHKVTFSARQIRVKESEVLALERELHEKGIEASSASPGRINIRVDQPALVK